MYPKHIAQAIIPPFTTRKCSCVLPVVIQIKYHRIKINNTCCGYRLTHNTQTLIHYCMSLESTFYTVVFLFIYIVALNKCIYVSMIYLLCLYECPWVILLTTCGRRTIVSSIEHTFDFTMETTTGFHPWYTTIQYNHRIISIELIYLRSAVVLVYWVYKYTTVDVNTPYRRFKCIIVGFFVIIYVLYATDFFICIYLYVYIHGILHMYIYIYLSHLLYIHSYILIHIFVFSRHYILTAHVFATTCETACNQRTDVRFNTFKIFDIIHRRL